VWLQVHRFLLVDPGKLETRNVKLPGMSHFCKYSYIITVFLMGLLWLSVGCRSSSEEQGSSATERQRKTASPQAREHLVRAYDHYERGAYRTALAYTDSAAQVDSTLTDLHFLRGRIFTGVNLYEKADEEYRAVLSSDSTYQGAWLNLGNNAARRGRFREALRRYNRELAHHATPSAWVSAGRAYMNLRKPDSARYAYRRALELDSTHAPAHVMLSELYDQAGELDSALHHVQAALRLEPENNNYRYEVGALQVRLGETERAIDPLKVVARERPFHYGAHYNLGMALQQLGREGEAEEYLTKADSLQRLQARLQRLEKAARSNPDNALAWARLGDALRRIDRTDKAQEAYNVALSIAPESIVLQNNVANLALMQGNYEQALNRYQAILQQDSANADVWLNVGVVHARMGNVEAAQRAWKTVLEYAPDHKTARKYLAKYEKKP
jgi:tetratricopeptide (TPR) repeat protein